MSNSFFSHLKSSIFPLLWFGREGSPTTIEKHAHRSLDFPSGRTTKFPGLWSAETINEFIYSQVHTIWARGCKTWLEDEGPWGESLRVYLTLAPYHLFLPNLLTAGSQLGDQENMNMAIWDQEPKQILPSLSCSFWYPCDSNEKLTASCQFFT